MTTCCALRVLQIINLLLQMQVSMNLSVTLIRMMNGTLTTMQMKQENVTIKCLGLRMMLMKKRGTRNNLTL